MLRPSKTEVTAIAALLEQGAESPEALAEEVIKAVERLRHDREQWFTVFELNPGVYQGYGPYPTRNAAEKATPKIPMAQIARRGGFVPMLGPTVAERQLVEADAPPAERADFALVREDMQAKRAGWKGNQRDRSQFLAS